MINKTIIYHVDFVLNKCLKSKTIVDNTKKIIEEYKALDMIVNEEPQNGCDCSSGHVCTSCDRDGLYYGQIIKE